jgi:hypothetical protein
MSRAKQTSACTVCHWIAAPCVGCGRYQLQDVHAVDGPDGRPQWWCGKCCPVCGKENREINGRN